MLIPGSDFSILNCPSFASPSNNSLILLLHTSSAKAAKSLAAAKDVVVVTGKGIVEVSSTDILSTGAAVALNKNKKEE